MNYTYDNASRRATMTVVGQPQVTYTYDNANRLTTITQSTSTVTIGYDDADRRTSVTYPNTNSITYAYNAASEFTSLTYKQGATTLGDLTYTYDAAGNRIKTGGTFARSNIPPALTTTNYNANNQQTTFGTSTETFDLNGNLATFTDASGTTIYTWNARNQLTSITGPSLAASFNYDSFDRRTGKTINGTTTNFLYDGLNPVQEKSGATVTANLLTGLGIDELFTRTDGVGVRSLLPDALGSTVALGDGTGAQTQYTYEPFGFTAQTGAASTNSYKYTGREDDGSGLYYYRARYYQPRLQRFISEDPLGFKAGDVNIYAYVHSDPLSWIDPLGFANTGWIPSNSLSNLQLPPDNSAAGQISGATNDFLRNYLKMRQANTIGADTYFHCMANCQAAQRGNRGEATSCAISDFREWVDQNIFRDPPATSSTDQRANETGRNRGGISSLPCEFLCGQFRPNGLPSKY